MRVYRNREFFKFRNAGKNSYHVLEDYLVKKGLIDNPKEGKF